MRLGEIKLNDSVDILKDQEMKMVKGGYGYSSYCYSGEYLFSCTVSFSGGNSVSGGACATSKAEAESKVRATYISFGYGSGDITPICN